MLSDPKFLVEDYRTEDLFDFAPRVDDLRGKINSVPNQSLIGIVGNYGMGKSTLLEKTHEALARDEDIIWVHFDAWKYPERTNLWEGFVLDFVRQVSPEDFKKILQIMEGTSSDAKKKLTKLAGSVINVGVAGAGAVIGKVADFFVTSPAKRVFQIQEVFTEILNKEDVRQKQIYIVIEDADRSGDAGTYFIETLSHFLRDSEPRFENQIQVFVPIASKSFIDKRDAYIKALDFVEFFDITSRDFNKFVQKVFSPEITSNSTDKSHFVEWLQRLITDHGLSFRDIKFIIRNSESRYHLLQEKDHTPDPRIVLILESCRYIKDADRADKGSLHQTIRHNRFLSRGSDGHLLLLSIGQNQEVGRMADTINNLRGGDSDDDIYRNAVDFVKDQDSFKNVPHPVQRGAKYYLPDYYLG